MGTLNVRDTDDAVSSMRALRKVLTQDLDEIVSRLEYIDQFISPDDEEGAQEIIVYQTARTALLSGLASIDEVLAWIRLAAAKDNDGNELECVKALPEMPVQRTN
jgi:hypothetical protein